MKKVLFFLIVMFPITSCITQLHGKGIREKVADFYYNNFAYKKAISYYTEIAKSKRANPEIVRKTADCYNKIGDNNNALKWYRKLYKKNWANLDDKYEYLLVLRKAAKYEFSLDILRDYLQSGGQENFAKFLKKYPNYVEELQAQSRENKYEIQKLPFNCDEHDFGACFFEDGIIYASPDKSRRKVTNENFAWDMTRFLQLYLVIDQGEGKYSTPKPFNFSYHTKYHDGPVTFNRECTEAFLTRNNYSAKGRLKKHTDGTVQVNLFTSYRKANNKWSKLEPFPYNSTEYSIGCATLSKEGDIIVFASDMPGGNGLSDLWLCKRDEEGKWSTPAHLGNNINTSRRDNYPFLDDEGNLYFSSDGGLYGLGGYDIYWVPGFLSGQDKVYNLGAPINSNADDFGYIYNSRTTVGYFNSGRKGVKGHDGKDDIFTFKKLISLVSVQVLDKQTEEPIPEAIGHITTSMREVIEGNIPADKEGIFEKELAPSSYIFSAQADGYAQGEIQIDVPKGLYFNTKILLEKEKKEETQPCPEITLEEIFYDFDKYAIRDDASEALDELAEFLYEYPKAKINLIAHTDSRGTHTYNNELSLKRAEAAVKYLEKKGIVPERMAAFGAGEKELINNCKNGVPCSEVEHQANRRTTVEIIMDGCLEVKQKSNKYLIEQEE